MRNLCRLVVLVVAVLSVASCLTVPPAPGSLTGETGPSTAPAETTDGSPQTPEVSPPQGGSDAANVEHPANTVAAPPAVVPNNGVEIAARVLAAGDQSSVRIPATATITSQSVLRDVWFAIHANQLDPPPLPEVNFATETVIVVILGERPSAGYSVRFATVKRTTGGVAVTIEVRAPGADRMTASVLTSPFEISAVATTGVPVSFVGDDITEGFDTE